MTSRGFASTIATMFTAALFRELYRHMEWADARVWSAVTSSDAASSSEKILQKLRHIHRTQQFFLKVWRGEEIVFQKIEGTLADEYALVRQYYGEIHPFVASVDESAFPRELSLPWADRFAQRSGLEKASPTTLGDTLFQAVAHTNYHRGQANTLLRELGIEPPLVDYIAWLWLGKPDIAWP